LRAIDLGILSTLDLRSTLDILLEKIDEHLPYPATTVRIFNKETDQLELKAWRNVEIEQLVKNASAETRALPHLVFQSSKAISITDIASYAKNAEELLIPEGYKSYLGVPLAAKGELIGVLSFYTKEQHEFTAEEIDFLTTVAGQGSIAIDNSLLYERTKAQAAELAVSNRIKGEFLSIVSHELRTPVNVISGYSNLVYEGMFGVVNPDQKKALQTIRKHTDELLTIIENMLEATKLRAGDIKVMLGVFRMADILENLKARFDRPVENDVVFQWDFPPDLPAFRTDGNKVLLILKNLIENALKFTATGTVTVSARHDSLTSSVKIMVQDTGIGISEDMQAGIFEGFRQGDSSDTRTYGGVGLGLYIVKRFTDLLGGTIEVESRLGDGSKFTVTLPASATAIVSLEKNTPDVTEDAI
jgi:signal transduction histidine kinase